MLRRRGISVLAEECAGGPQGGVGCTDEEGERVGARLIAVRLPDGVELKAVLYARLPLRVLVPAVRQRVSDSSRVQSELRCSVNRNPFICCL